jgi:hypothetical protein
MNQILDLLRTADSFAAIEHIQRGSTPPQIAERYDSLVRDLYWKAHNLSAVITIGRAGILYCLSQLLVAETPSETAGNMANTAKLLAYNVASFIWPGWDEPGINPTPDEIAFGHDCARLNLRLAIQLNRPPQGLSKAHWLLGAYALCLRHHAQAALEFQRAQDVIPITDPAYQQMEPLNRGYLAIAHLAATPADPAAQSSFQTITAHLAAQTDEDSKSYLSQLTTAHRLFVPTPPISH